MRVAIGFGGARHLMARKVGLWIDHTKALLVSLDGDDVTTRTVLSDAGKRPRIKGGSPSVTPYGSQDATYEARRDRKYEQLLKEYYDGIVSAVSGAGAILIMGPAEAKVELGKRLEASGVPIDSVTTVAADKMTDAQVVEKVKIHYDYPTRQTF